MLDQDITSYYLVSIRRIFLCLNLGDIPAHPSKRTGVPPGEAGPKTIPTCAAGH